ncbi:MAG: hypothetical protein ACTHQ3_10600, partial [Motilibacteraceae bacterium]
HSQLRMPAGPMTARMVAAVSNPHVDVLGHCTGRMLGGRTKRPESAFHADAVFGACREHGVAVEINCRPERMDPPDPLLARASDVAAAVHRAAAPFRVGTAQRLEVDVTLRHGRRLVGSVGGLHGSTLVSVTASRLGPRHLLTAWTNLLALGEADPDAGWRAVVVGRDPDARGPAGLAVSLGPVEPAAAHAALLDLVALRDAGLRTPLPLPLRTSASFARRADRSSVGNALTWAGRDWRSDQAVVPGENKDREHEQVWGVDAPLATLQAWTPPADLFAGPLAGRLRAVDESGMFGALARLVWRPVLAAEGRP